MTWLARLVAGLAIGLGMTLTAAAPVVAQDDDSWTGCTSGDIDSTVYLAQHYSELTGFRITIYPANQPTTLRYELDWGDDTSQVATYAEVTAGLSHIWPAYGDYVVSYRPVDESDCRGPRRYAYLPIHQFHVAAQVERANADGSRETVSYPAGSDSPTIYLTNGQSSKFTVWLADENETPYARGTNGSVTDFRWRYACFDYPAQDCILNDRVNVAPTPRGKILLGRDNEIEQSFYYLPAWEEETSEAFGVSLDHNQISYQGQNIHIMPRGVGALYRVTRPKIKVATTGWTSGDAILTNDEPISQELSISNTPDYYINIANAGMAITPTVTSDVPWLTVSTLSSADVGVTAAVTLTITLTPAGLSPGTHTGTILITTPSVSWPAADPWGNTFDDPTHAAFVQALNTPYTVPVTVIVADPDTTPLTPPPVPSL